MEIKPTQYSLDLVREITNQVQSMHHHYHILYDIANTYPDDYTLNYLEIGCYAGGSSCLLLQRPNTNVITIDLGTPIHPAIVEHNVQKFNRHNNQFKYIQGNSADPAIINQITEDIDILFIDGDHSYNGSLNDFNNYSKLVKNNGYIIFDDYNDLGGGCKVHEMVDELVITLDRYEIIGTIKNDLGANGFEDNFKDGNCFIIRKKI